jgi:AraC-like DNA-binding protein
MIGGSGSTSVTGRSGPGPPAGGATIDGPIDDAADGPVDERIDEHCRRAPAEPLRPYVAWYTGYRQRGIAPARHRGLPSPFLTLIFTLDEPLTMVAHPDPGQPPGEFGTLLGGLHSTPALIAHDGAQSGIQVALRPLGTRALLGLPAGELAGLDVPAEAVLGGVCAELRARLLAAAGWRERFAVLDEILLRAAAWPGVLPATPEVGWAWRQLMRAGGTTRVSDLAAQTGWSARHLTSRFRTEIGLTPKAAARVIRFHRTRQLLIRQVAVAGRETKLADLAATCGYFDQAHLAREFRALAGCPPSQWLAEEFRNIQAGAWPGEEALNPEAQETHREGDRYDDASYARTPGLAQPAGS